MSEDVVERHEFDAEFGSHGRIRERVVSDEAHIERLRHAKQFSPDIADAHGSKSASDQAYAHVI